MPTIMIIAYTVGIPLVFIMTWVVLRISKKNTARDAVALELWNDNLCLASFKGVDQDAVIRAGWQVLRDQPASHKVTVKGPMAYAFYRTAVWSTVPGTLGMRDK